MKKVIFVAVTLVFMFAQAEAQAQYLSATPGSEMRLEMNMEMQQETASPDSYLIALHSHPDYILPKKALLFSALIPGAGEIYCGSYLKGLLFLGLEAGAWTMYAVFTNKGNDKEDEFKAYANEYWDEDKWNAWFDNLTEEEQNVFSHSLPETKTQQYYEMIGKYNQFLVGWEGVPIDLTSSEIQLPENTSPLREDYMDMRYDSNQMFKRATTGAYLAMFNHLLSAIDAAWTAKRHNRGLITTSLRFENKNINSQSATFLTMQLNW